MTTKAAFNPKKGIKQIFKQQYLEHVIEKIQEKTSSLIRATSESLIVVERQEKASKSTRRLYDIRNKNRPRAAVSKRVVALDDVKVPEPVMRITLAQPQWRG